MPDFDDPDDPGLALLRRMRGTVQAAAGDEDPGEAFLRQRRSTGSSYAGPDRRFDTARGRRSVEQETLGNQLAQYEESFKTATGERKARLGRQIEQLKKDLSPWGGGPEAASAGRRFLGGVAAAAPQMALSLADLAMAPLQVAEGALGRDAQWGRGIRSWIAERQIGIEEATGSRGLAGIAGNLAGGVGLGVVGSLAKSVPVLGTVARVANIGGEGYARLANATLRFVGKAKPIEPLARAAFEGGRLSRAAGNVAADLPWNALQIGTMEDMSPADALRAVGLGAVGSGVGGAISPRTPFVKPKFKPDLGSDAGPGNADEYAQGMTKQMQLIKAWQDANPDKSWTDATPEDRAVILEEPVQTPMEKKSAADLLSLSSQLRGFLLGDNQNVDVAMRAYNTLVEQGANPDVILSILGMRLENNIPVAPDGRAPSPERLLLASGEAPREVVAAARVESNGKTHRSERMNRLMNKAREDLRVERQERRAAQRAAMSDNLIPEMQGQRAWQEAMPSIEADPETHIVKFDINNFKALNDALGQSAGDEVIRNVGRIIAGTAEAGGVRAFRIGGDEFVIAGPLGVVAQMRHEIETLMYGSQFQDQVLSMSGGIGQTLREAELDLGPRKLDTKKSLGQPLSRGDTEYLKQPLNESLPTVQVFKAIREAGLEDVVRQVATGFDQTNPHIAAETAARSVLGQLMEMSSTTAMPHESIVQKLREIHGLVDPASVPMPRPGVSRGAGDVSQPSPVRGAIPEPIDGPGSNVPPGDATALKELRDRLKASWGSTLTDARKKRIAQLDKQIAALEAKPIVPDLDAAKARWNALEDQLDDLDPGTAEFNRIQSEASQLWAEIDALGGFDAGARPETPPPATEPRPATEPIREAPLSPTSKPDSPLETTKLRAPLAEMGPAEIEGIIDEILAPFDKNPALMKTEAFAAAQRDITKLRDAYDKVKVGDKPTGGFALEQTPDEVRLTELTAKPLTELKEAELTELNVLLQNINNRLPPDAPMKNQIVDQLLELRSYQHEREVNKNRGRGKKGKTEAQIAEEMLEKAALRYAKKLENKKKGTEGFTIPEAQAAIVASGVGGLLGYAYPTEDDDERLRNAFLGAVLAGGATASTFYLSGKAKAARNLSKGAAIPGEQVLSDVMRTTVNDEVLARFNPIRIVKGIWEGMDRAYAGTLHPSMGGERIARTLALGAKVGKQVGDILATFGLHRRVANDWIFKGPRELDVTTQQWKPVTVTRHDGTVAQVLPVAQILESVGGDMEKLGKTALALSAAEQWIKYGRMPHPDLDPINVERFLRNVDQSFLFAAQAMRDVHLGLLDMQVKAGLLSKATRAKLGAEEFYTAMERLFGDGLDQGMGKNIGDKIKGLFAQRPVKARKGPNDYDIRNPVETLWIAIARTAKAVEMNEKKAALISLWEASNVPEEVKLSFMRPMIKTQKEHAAQAGYKQQIALMKSLLPNLTPGEAQAMIDAFDPLPLGPKSNFMTYIRDGESEVWRLSPELVHTFGYMQGWEISDMWRVLGVGSNLARKGVAMSPDFVGRIAFFDVFQSALNSQWGMRPGLDWLVAFKHIVTNSPEYQSWGGGTAESTMLENLSNPIDILRKSKGQGVIKSLKHGNLIDAYKAILIPFAEAGRFSEDMAALRHGATVQEAIRASMAVGGYYNQTGLYAAGLFHAVPFAKGVTQSLDQTLFASGLHPFREYDGNRMTQAIKWWGKGATMIGLPTLFFYLANKDDEEITQLRQSENGRRNWYFRLPNGGIFSVRKPAGPEGQLFGTGLEIFMDAWRGKEPEAFEQFAQSMLNELQVPWLPPAVQAGVALKTGMDVSFGSPMISQRLQGLPTSMQANSSTTDFSQALSEGLTNVTGEPTGFWERALSPIGIEYIARTLGGTLGKEALQLADFAQGWVEHGSVPAAREWPILRRLLTVDMTRAQTRDMEDFYDFAGKAEKIVGGLNESLRGGDVQGFVDITSKYSSQELAAMKLVLSTRGGIAQTQRAIEELRDTEGGDTEARKQVIMNLRRVILQRMNTALQTARAMENSFRIPSSSSSPAQ